jgi:hypothetical protein
VKAARARGDDLTGLNGLLGQLTATVLETALDGEMAEHLGYEKHGVAGRGSGNSRNGTRSKTVLTDNAGPVQITVPRDRNGSFEPVIVAKHQRRLGDVDTIALSLYAKGLTTGEISAHFEDIYGASISKDRISRITDRVIDEINKWCARPLLPVYAAIFIDAIHVKVRDGHVANRAFYAAIGADLEGHRDKLGGYPFIVIDSTDDNSAVSDSVTTLALCNSSYCNPRAELWPRPLVASRVRVKSVAFTARNSSVHLPTPRASSETSFALPQQASRTLGGLVRLPC